MIETLISGIALLVSVLAYRRSNRDASLSERLTVQEIELVRHQLSAITSSVQEEKMAKVSARMFKEGKGWKVRVYNAGPSEAKNVRLVLDDQNELIAENAISDKFPMKRMEQGQSVDIWAYVHNSSPSKETLLIRWDDQSGIDQENRIELTV